MMETLLGGGCLFVNKFEYGPNFPFTHVRLPGLHKPHTGDIIVFQFPVDPTKDFIKRCIATEGQTVEVRNKLVYVDGRHSDAADAHAKHVDPSVRPCDPEEPAYPDDPSLRQC